MTSEAYPSYCGSEADPCRCVEVHRSSGSLEYLDGTAAFGASAGGWWSRLVWLTTIGRPRRLTIVGPGVTPLYPKKGVR